MGISKLKNYSAEQLDFAAHSKALGHPARVAILQHIMNSKACINSELTHELGLAQATISQHIKELNDLGLIIGTVKGKSMYYRVNPKGWSKLKVHFEEFFNHFNHSDIY